MLDELFELFERNKGRKKSPGGLRGRIGRAIAGDDHRDDDRHRREDRRYHRDDDGDDHDRGRSKRSRFGDAFDFD